MRALLYTVNLSFTEPFMCIYWLRLWIEIFIYMPLTSLLVYLYKLFEEKKVEFNFAKCPISIIHKLFKEDLSRPS